MCAWADRRRLNRLIAVIVTIECAFAIGFGVVGNIPATLYTLGLAVLALVFWAWRSPRISKKL